jgi:hypothetical protein
MFWGYFYMDINYGSQLTINYLLKVALIVTQQIITL